MEERRGNPSNHISFNQDHFFAPVVEFKMKAARLSQLERLKQNRYAYTSYPETAEAQQDTKEDEPMDLSDIDVFRGGRDETEEEPMVIGENINIFRGILDGTEEPVELSATSINFQSSYPLTVCPVEANETCPQRTAGVWPLFHLTTETGEIGVDNSHSKSPYQSVQDGKTNTTGVSLPPPPPANDLPLIGDNVAAADGSSSLGTLMAVCSQPHIETESHYMLGASKMRKAARLLSCQFKHRIRVVWTCSRKPFRMKQGVLFFLVPSPESGRPGHWVCLFCNAADGVVHVLDSCSSRDPEHEYVRSVVVEYCDSTGPLVLLHTGTEGFQYPQQIGDTHCGYYVIAYAVDLLSGRCLPFEYMYDQERMPGHLERCFKSGKFELFPQVYVNPGIYLLVETKIITIIVGRRQDSDRSRRGLPIWGGGFMCMLCLSENV